VLPPVAQHLQSEGEFADVENLLSERTSVVGTWVALDSLGAQRANLAQACVFRGAWGLLSQSSTNNRLARWHAIAQVWHDGVRTIKWRAQAAAGLVLVEHQFDIHEAGEVSQLLLALYLLSHTPCCCPSPSGRRYYTTGKWRLPTEEQR